MKLTYTKLNQKGQIVVEYVLLLIIAVSIAALMTQMMVQRNPDSPGFVIQKWSSFLEVIGQDYADDVGGE